MREKPVFEFLPGIMQVLVKLFLRLDSLLDLSLELNLQLSHHLLQLRIDDHF
jgi:hypothetical protein